MKALLKRLALVSSIAGSVALSASLPVVAQDTLYQRLGGYDAIAAVVDDFFGRMAKEEHNARFFNDIADDRKKLARQLTVDFICEAAGGPCIYNGRDMVKTHKGMGITLADWDASVVLLQETLNSFSVPENEQTEVFGLIGGLKDQLIDQ